METPRHRKLFFFSANFYKIKQASFFTYLSVFLIFLDHLCIFLVADGKNMSNFYNYHLHISCSFELKKWRQKLYIYYTTYDCLLTIQLLVSFIGQNYKLMYFARRWQRGVGHKCPTGEGVEVCQTNFNDFSLSFFLICYSIFQTFARIHALV